MFASVLLASFAFSGAAPREPETPARALNILEIFGTDDYPPEAIRAEASGTTGVVLRVTKEGKATDCVVGKSSGNEALDRRTCEIFLAEGRFSPAQDRRGRPIEADMTIRVQWVLPEQDPSEIPTFRRLTMTVGPEGELRQCAAEMEIGGKPVGPIPESVCRGFVESTEARKAFRRGSSVHDAVVVMENRVAFEQSEPAPQFGRGSGQRLVAVRSARMQFDINGNRTSCTRLDEIGLKERAGLCEEPVNIYKQFGYLAAMRRVPVDVRIWWAVYLTDEPE